MWIKDWPTEEGLYWLYGDIFGMGEKELHFVKAFSSGRPLVPSIVYISEGHFLYMSETKDSLWQKCVPPEIPQNKEDV